MTDVVEVMRDTVLRHGLFSRTRSADKTVEIIFAAFNEAGYVVVPETLSEEQQVAFFHRMGVIGEDCTIPQMYAAMLSAAQPAPK